MGFSLIDDTSSPNALCDGISVVDSTVDQNRRRVSTLEAFLPRAIALQRESNLTICTGVIVSRIKFSGDHAEHRAEEVIFQYANLEFEKVFSVRVNKEVILSSGAIGSPQVLMLRSVVSTIIISDPVRERMLVNSQIFVVVLGRASIWKSTASKLYVTYQALDLNWYVYLYRSFRQSRGLNPDNVI